MSALSTHSESRTHWVPIDTAAELLGKSQGQMRRICLGLEKQGQAIKILVDRAHKWHIAASYSPRLIRGSIEADDNGKSELHEVLKTTPLPKLERAQLDALILIEFRQIRSGKYSSFDMFKLVMKEEHGRCLGKSRLYEMDKLCPPSDDKEGIVYTLIDRRGRKGGDVKCCSDAAWKQFCTLYLTQQQWSIAKCYRSIEALSKEYGWDWPSMSRIKQLIKSRLDPSMITLKREGQDAWNRMHLAPMEQDPNAWDAGQCWESDHSKLDFHIRVFNGKEWTRTRPQLTAWFDRRTRLLAGYHICEQGTQYTIRAAMLNALKNDHVSAPDHVWLDNGKDFMASSIGGMTKAERRKSTRDEKNEAEATSTGLLSMLGITPHFAAPYNHNGKARIERFFGTVHNEFDKEFPSYCGNKPGMLDHRDQLAMQKDIMKLPTLEDVRAKFVEFADWYNHRSDHSIDDLRDPDTLQRLSPIEFYNRFLPSKRTIRRETLTLLEPVWSKPLKVYKHGVNVKFGSATIRFGEMQPELEPLVGTDRRVYASWDPDDTNQVTIWTDDFKLLCIAQENGRYGGLAQDKVTRQDRQKAFNLRKEQKKRAKQKIDVVTSSLSDAELASKMVRDREVAKTQLKMAEFDRDRDPADFPPLRLTTTRIDDAPHDIEEQKQRLAVGAEFMNPDDCGSLIDAVADLHSTEPTLELCEDSINAYDEPIPTIEHTECDDLLDAMSGMFPDEQINDELRIVDQYE